MRKMNYNPPGWAQFLLMFNPIIFLIIIMDGPMWLAVLVWIGSIPAASWYFGEDE